MKILKVIKELFSPEKEPEPEKIKVSELNKWFEDKVAKIEFNNHAQEFLKQIKQVKEQIPELINDLNNAKISKDNKNVEDRVKNIVKGHKDNFSREIERFKDDLEIIQKEQFKTLKDYQEVIDYNKELDKKIEGLAKRTAKSYQAAQHLFFKEVEALFKKTGEINTLVKEFDKTIKNVHLEKLSTIKEMIQELNHSINKKKDFSKEIKEKEDSEKEIKNLVAKEEKEKEELKKSTEYKEHQKIEASIGEVEQKIKNNDDKIFSYFSKLNKPLRKYERIALDNKVIQSYINDGIKSFWQDSELKVKESLQGLKKSLQDESIQFEDKQKNNFLELIKKSETGHLEELKEVGQKFRKEREELLKKVEDVEIIFKIEEVNKKINSNNEKMASLQDRISELKSKLDKIDLDKIKKEIVDNINQKLKIKLELISSS
jgi:chromosome segregation ATPase